MSRTFSRLLGTVLTGVTALSAVALISTSTQAASAATVVRPSVRAASTAVHVTTSKVIHVGVTARHVHRGDRLTVQQYYQRRWHSLLAYRVARTLSTVRHTFGLGRAPAGRYLIRVALIRNSKVGATTKHITIYCKNAVPPPPPPPPAP